MDRRNFLQLLGLLPVMTTMDLTTFANITDGLKNTEKMPVFFVGHGDPMNVLRDNPFTQSLTSMGKSLVQKPSAILVVSAHWLTRGSFVCSAEQPETIYDFGGFPEAMYQIKYPAPGSPAYAKEVEALIPEVHASNEWGLDHGAWTVLKHMFPAADIPVFQLSIDYHQPMQYHFDLAKRLKSLRNKGVLIIGSGNIVHNLRAYFTKEDTAPFDWTIEFDSWVKDKLDTRDFKSLVEYEKKGQTAKLAVPTVDHYVPMLYTTALAEANEPLLYTYEENLSSISMRCFKIG